MKKPIDSRILPGKTDGLCLWVQLEGCGHWRQVKRVKTPLKKRRFTCPACRRTEEYWRRRRASSGEFLVD